MLLTIKKLTYCNLSSKIRLDIQATFTASARKDVTKDTKIMGLNLSNTDMIGANLKGGNLCLERANLHHTKLDEANFREVNLYDEIGIW